MREGVAALRTLGRRELGGRSPVRARAAAGPAGWSHGAQIAAIIAVCLAVSALSLLFPLSLIHI